MSLRKQISEGIKGKAFPGLNIKEVSELLAIHFGANVKTVNRILYLIDFNLNRDSRKILEDYYLYNPKDKKYLFGFKGLDSLLKLPENTISKLIKWYVKEGSNLSLRKVCKKCWKELKISLDEKTLSKVFRTLKITKTSPPLAPHILSQNTIEDSIKDWRLIAESEIEEKVSNKNHWKKLYEKERKKDLSIESLVEKVFEDYIQKPKLTLNQEIYKPIFELEPSIPILMLSDWHVGMKDLKFNKEVLHKRVKTLISQLSDWITSYKRPFEEFHICLGGDLLDGAVELRSGHSKQQDIYGSEQIAEAADLLALVINWIKSILKVSVKVHAVTGNHGRASRHYKDDPERVCERVLYLFTERLTPGVDWDIAKEIVTKWEVFNTTVFLSHGDLTPKDMYSLVLSHSCTPPALVLSGHYHELSVSQKNRVFMVTGGSLCGTTSFSRDRLGLASSPAQVLVEVRKEGPRPVIYLPVNSETEE